MHAARLCKLSPVPRRAMEIMDAVEAGLAGQLHSYDGQRRCYRAIYIRRNYELARPGHIPSSDSLWQTDRQGTRISVEQVLSLLAGGSSWADILDNYPRLRAEDIAACLTCAAEMAAAQRELPLAS